MTGDPTLPDSVEPTPVEGGGACLPPILEGATQFGLQELVGLAVAEVGRSAPHRTTTHCGITLAAPDLPPETIAATDDVPVRVDWLQQEFRQGPCLDAVRRDSVLVCSDLSADERWPQFGRLCVEVIGTRSMLCVRVPAGDGRWACTNVYSSAPGAFDDPDADLTRSLARIASLAAEGALRELGGEAADSTEGAYSRLAIALGIVMGRYRVSSERAFGMLLDASGDLGRTLSDLAAQVIQEGHLPPRRP